MNPLLISGVLSIGTKIIERLFPDEQARAKAELELLAMQQAGELKELETQMSAIVMEAKSDDPWTSRARPSFLYVVYVIILSAIPMGFITAADPHVAIAITEGFRGWLAAIPEEMWGLFGVGYLGYVGGRSYDKRKLLEYKGRGDV